jgi:hypothetical protein
MSDLLPDFDSQLSPSPQLSRPSPNGELAAWLLVISICLALMNVALNPIFEGTNNAADVGAWWETFCIGSLGGQTGILAIAAVLGPSFGLRRHLVVIPLFAILAVSWLLGFVISHEIHGYTFPPLKGVVAELLVLPSMFCVCELPLWIFRTFLRWRIESPTRERVRPPQLTIAGILGATAAVALSLGAIRLGNKLTGGMREADWWIGGAFAAAWCGGASLLVLPVVTALVFRPQSLVIGLLVSAAWIALLIIAFLMVTCSLAGSVPWGELHLFLFIAAGFMATLLGPLALCRLYGYRLLWGRETR